VGTIDRRLVTLERRTVGRPELTSRAVREALRRLSLAELEALESTVVTQEAGRVLDEAQRAAMDAWERAAADTAP
jgi:hypothetical protein